MSPSEAACGRLAKPAIDPAQGQRTGYLLARLMREHKALNLPRDDAWLDFADLPSERVLTTKNQDGAMG